MHIIPAFGIVVTAVSILAAIYLLWVQRMLWNPRSPKCWGYVAGVIAIVCFNIWLTRSMLLSPI